MSKSIFCINRAKHFLPQGTLITLYHSLVHSHLLYFPLKTSFSSNQDLEKIFKIQKKAIRIVSNFSYHAHTAPLFAKHKILPFNKILLQAINYIFCTPYTTIMLHPLSCTCAKKILKDLYHTI